MSKKTPNDGSLQSTKQMLDELDALMERMLSLPVNDLEESGSPPEGPVVSAKLSKLEPPAPTYQTMLPALEEPAEEEPRPLPPLNPPHFGRPVGPSRRAPLTATLPPAAALPEPEPLTNNVSIPSALPTLEPMLADIPEPAAVPATSGYYLPLLWINQGFDQVARLLPGGGWLRSSSGRTLLGLSGILMTLSTVVWLLKDWLGWNWR